MECPHSEFDLNIATLSLGSKVDILETIAQDNVFDNWLKENEKYANKAELNQGVAESNGISVETLINSPNYSTLTNEFKSHKLYTLIAMLEEKGLTNQEAWALVVMGMEKWKILQ